MAQLAQCGARGRREALRRAVHWIFLGARDLPGVALRYGFFYGPGTYYDPIDGSVSEQVREQAYPVIGSGGVFSFVHVEDASAATVAALESDPGVYNVVEVAANRVPESLSRFSAPSLFLHAKDASEHDAEAGVC